MEDEADGATTTDDAGSDDDPPDPAVFASRNPEPSEPDDPVYAVGIGPGNRDYLTPRGRRAIENADVVVGFETVVDYIEEYNTETLSCGYSDEGDTLRAFADRVASGERGTAVLMGDPNFSGYQFLGKVQRTVDRPVRVIPGISSLQIAASRARTPMEDSTFVTLHKRGDLADDLDRLVADAASRHLLVLPRPFDWMPGDIADHLLDAGIPDRDALVLERLTHDDESITRTRLSELAADAGEDSPFSDLSVLVVRRE